MSRIAKAVRGPLRRAAGVPKRSIGSNRGEVVFPFPATTTWAVPPGVNSVCIVCVGGGGGAYSSTNAGGGGALAWVNDVPVRVGDEVEVTTGVMGASSVSIHYPQSGGFTEDGGTSKVVINGTTVVEAEGGHSAGTNTGSGDTLGGSVIVGSGGSGGTGGIAVTNTSCAGGGGAGGYSGPGADGIQISTVSTALAGNAGSGGGGGSGGGNIDTNSGMTGGSGGVNIYGEGASGAAGTASAEGFGGGGSGGQDGGSVNSGANGGNYSVGEAGMFGAGGSVHAVDSGEYYPRSGASGVVRIIWGRGRAFPSTDVGQS